MTIRRGAECTRRVPGFCPPRSVPSSFVCLYRVRHLEADGQLRRFAMPLPGLQCPDLTLIPFLTDTPLRASYQPYTQVFLVVNSDQNHTFSFLFHPRTAKLREAPHRPGRNCPPSCQTSYTVQPAILEALAVPQSGRLQCFAPFVRGLSLLQD